MHGTSTTHKRTGCGLAVQMYVRMDGGGYQSTTLDCTTSSRLWGLTLFQTILDDGGRWRGCRFGVGGWLLVETPTNMPST